MLSYLLDLLNILYNNSSISQEFNKHDKEPAKYIKQWRGVKPKTGAPYSCDIGYERFLGPEVCSTALKIFSIIHTYISQLVLDYNTLTYIME